MMRTYAGAPTSKPPPEPALGRAPSGRARLIPQADAIGDLELHLPQPGEVGPGTRRGKGAQGRHAARRRMPLSAARAREPDARGRRATNGARCLRCSRGPPRGSSPASPRRAHRRARAGSRPRVRGCRGSRAPRTAPPRPQRRAPEGRHRARRRQSRPPSAAARPRPARSHARTWRRGRVHCSNPTAGTHCLHRRGLRRSIVVRSPVRAP